MRLARKALDAESFASVPYRHVIQQRAAHAPELHRQEETMPKTEQRPLHEMTTDAQARKPWKSPRRYRLEADETQMGPFANPTESSPTFGS